MSADPIQVSVTDSVAGSVSTKLLAIADAALKGADSVEKLQAMLDGLDASGVTKLVKAQADLESQTAKNNIAYLKQEDALNKAIASETNAAVAALKLADAQTKVADATAKATDAANKAASAVNAFGETEADVAARIAGVGAAAAQQQKTLQGLNLTGSDVATSQQKLATATRAASDSAKTAAANYSGYVSALNTLGKNPTAAGVDPAKVKAGTAALEDQQHMTAGVTRELIVLGHEAISGNFSRIPGSLLVLAERTGGLGGAFSTLLGLLNPMTILFGLAAAAVAVFTTAEIEAEEETARFNNTLNLTQNAAGLTSDSYSQMAAQIAAATSTSVNSNKALELQLAATGDFNRNEIAQLTEGIQLLSRSTGEETGKIVGHFKTLASAPENFSKALHEAFGITINNDIQDQINVLVKHGQTTEATALATQAFLEYMQTHGPEALTGIAKLLNVAATAASNFWTAIRGGEPDALGKLKNQLQDVLNSQADFAAGGDTDRAAALQAAVDSLNYQIKYYGQIQEFQQAGADADATAAKNRAAANKALSDGVSIWDRTKTAAERADEAVNKFRADIANIKNDPDAAGSQQGAYLIAHQKEIETQLRLQGARKTPVTDEQTRSGILNKINAGLDTQLRYYGEIKDVREANQKLDEIDDKLRTHTKGGKPDPLPTLNAAERLQESQKLSQIELNKRVEASEDAIYQNAIGPLLAYNAGTTALDELNSRHLLTTEQVAAQQLKLNDAYNAAIDPLYVYNKGVADQTALLNTNLTAQQRIAESQVQAANNQLRAQGKSQLTEGQANVIRQSSVELQKLNQYVQIYTQISGANQTQAQKLVDTQTALNEAREKGTISVDQYTTATVQNTLAQNQLALDLGQGFANMENVALGAIGKIVQGYKNALSGLSETFGSFFTSLEDGFANSVGKAIVYGGSLKASLLSVAQEGVSALIASLIKLGIQYVLTAALGTAIQDSALAASTAASAVAAGATATAWAPAAALVSLASFGANAAPAAIGIAAVTALTEAIAIGGGALGGGISNAGATQGGAGIGGAGVSDAVAGFAGGGYTGDISTTSVAGVVHGQEFVMNASATRANMSALKAMNAGQSVGTSGGGGVKVSIQNYGTSKDYEVEQISADEVRIIARDEASAAVRREAPTAVASEMTNPNSKVSKATQQNFNVQRNRT